MSRAHGVGRVRVASGVALLAATLVLSSMGQAVAAGSPPVAVADVAAVISGQSVTVDPLANDRDQEGDPLTVTSAAVATAGAGTAAVAGSQVVITAAAGFQGVMVVDYTISDGTATAASTITVTVTAPSNAAPVATPDSASMYAPAERRLRPLANDYDPDGDALRISSVTVGNPAAGTATLEGDEVLVRTTAGFAGPMLIDYTLVDARGARAVGRITISVLGPMPNTPPLAKADTAKVKVGATVRIRVLANDSDPDGDPIRLVKVGKASAGKATKRGSSIRFRAPRSPGKVRISYWITDSRGARVKGVVRVTVTKKRAKPTPPAGGNPSRVDVERALAALRLPVGSVNGSYDARTRRAVCAWRTVVGRSAHRGLPTAAEARAIVSTAHLPRARAVMVTGITVSVTCQAAFWVGSDRQYRRVMAASTGKAGYRTRLGTFRIFRTYRTWRYSTIYPEARMYKPMQFSGGQAIHGSATDSLVKTYPASHGCVRMLHRDIDALHAGGVGNGTRVRVIGRWRG